MNKPTKRDPCANEAPRVQIQPVVRDASDWKPYPCLLTKAEIQELIADQLG
ncbi:hypothetical protein [Oryzifoliimicrobium ureilyticus]|uniref:hypothetical protein n=1 Tax=Oryzifoliimicrobium ureilyticus TaxID=3113724 RepID=UPI0030764900